MIRRSVPSIILNLFDIGATTGSLVCSWHHLHEAQLFLSLKFNYCLLAVPCMKLSLQRTKKVLHENQDSSCGLLSTRRFAGVFPELLYGCRYMAASFTNLLECFYEGKHLQTFKTINELFCVYKCNDLLCGLGGA